GFRSELHREHGAAAGIVAGPDPAAVLLHDPASDCEPKPGTAVGTSGIRLIEALEDLLLLTGRDPGAAVAYHEPRSALRSVANPHHGLTSPVPARVVGEDPRQLGERVAVAMHERRLE